MSTTELRERLIKKIQNTEDENILQEVYRLLDLEVNAAEFYNLSAEQQQQIDAARLEIEQGKYLTDGDANKEIDEWLNK